MAMVRSALGIISRRLSSKILRAPALPSLRLHIAAPLIPRPGPAARMMRTFSSPATAAVPIRGVSNLSGQQLMPHILKGTEGMKCSEHTRFLSMQRKGEAGNFMELARPVLKRLKAWLSQPVDPRHEFMVVAFVGVTSVLSTAITYHTMGSHHNSIASGDNSTSEDRLFK